MSVPSRTARRSLVLITLACALTAACGWPGAAHAAGGLPPQGLYEQCGPNSHGEAQCLNRLERIRGAGFTVVLNYTLWYSTTAQLRNYLDRAQQLGVKVIVPMNAPAWRDSGSLLTTYKKLAQECPCSTHAEFKSWAVGLVRSHPAIWGYYVGDEATSAVLPKILALRSRLKQLDPTRPHLFVSMEDGATLGANLRPFAGAADVLGADIYPIGTNFGPGVTGPIAERTQHIAATNGRRSAIVLQSFSWSAYEHSMWRASGRFPTVAEMRGMRDLALANSRPDFVLWYSFQDIERSGDPAGRLAALRAAALAPRAMPETTLEGAPSGDGASFTARSNLGSSFHCAVDGRPWRPCAPAIKLTSLAPGPHSIVVRAADRTGGVDPTPAVRRWEVALPDEVHIASTRASSSGRKRRPAKCRRLRGARRKSCVRRARARERDRRRTRRRAGQRARL